MPQHKICLLMLCMNRKECECCSLLDKLFYKDQVRLKWLIFLDLPHPSRFLSHIKEEIDISTCKFVYLSLYFSQPLLHLFLRSVINHLHFRFAMSSSWIDPLIIINVFLYL